MDGDGALELAPEAEEPAGMGVSVTRMVGWMSIFCASSHALWAAESSCAFTAANGAAIKTENKSVLCRVFMSNTFCKDCRTSIVED